MDMSETACTTIRVFPSDRKRLNKRVRALKQQQPHATTADLIRDLLNKTEIDLRNVEST